MGNSPVKASKSRRRYTREEKAQALAAWKLNGENIKGTARELGIDPSTLKGWVRTYREAPDPLVAKAMAAVEAEFVDRFIDTADETIFEAQRLLKEKLPNASAAQLSLIIAQQVDKRNLLINNQKTSEQQAAGQSSGEEIANAITGWLDNVLKQSIERARGIEVVEAQIVEELEEAPEE